MLRLRLVVMAWVLAGGSCSQEGNTGPDASAAATGTGTMTGVHAFDITQARALPGRDGGVGIYMTDIPREFCADLGFEQLKVGFGDVPMPQTYAVGSAVQLIRGRVTDLLPSTEPLWVATSGQVNITRVDDTGIWGDFTAEFPTDGGSGTAEGTFSASYACLGTE